MNELMGYIDSTNIYMRMVVADRNLRLAREKFGIVSQELEKARLERHKASVAYTRDVLYGSGDE